MSKAKQFGFANDGSFFEQYQKLQQQQEQQRQELKEAVAAPTQREDTAPQPEQQQQPEAAPILVNGEEFVAASTFSRAFPGYFFGTGDSGTGYYLDTLLSRPPEPEKTQKKGVLPKSKPIVPGLKVAGGVAKRSKDASAPSSQYLAEMQRYREQSCASDGSGGRPLVK